MTLTLIMAADDNGGIGFKGGLPWKNHRADMASFVRHTLGKTCISSDKSYVDLIGRVCITCDRDTDWGWFQFNDNEFMLLGGANVYESALPFVDEFIFHRIRGEFECDTYAPFDLPWVKRKIL